MPKSKRARPVYLHGPKKKTREHKESLITNIRAALEKYQYVYVLEVKNMRNTYLKDVRQEFSDDGRLFFGKNTILSVSLGTTPSTSPLPGLHALIPHIRPSKPSKPSSSTQSHTETQVGLLLTSRPPNSVQSFFNAFHPLDYARAGTQATRSFSIPAGQIYAPSSLSLKHDDKGEEAVPVAATREPELRKLGVPTKLNKGKVENVEEKGYPVCKTGQVLDSRQTALLKFFGEKMAVFAVGVRAYWSSGTGEVEAVEAHEGEEGMEVDEDEDEEGEDEEDE